MQPLFNEAMSCALGKVGKPRMALKDEQQIAIQYVYMARTCLHGYQQIWQVHMYEFLPFVFVPHIHFGKAEVAFCHCRLASCSCTLQSYILANISPCYLQVQVTYLDELYGECSRTACACVNSGYQVLLSDFFKHLGTRLYLHICLMMRYISTFL